MVDVLTEFHSTHCIADKVNWENIFTDWLYWQQLLGYDGNTRSQKPVRLISFDLSDDNYEDSDSDAEPHSYQDTKNTNEAFWPSPRPDNRNLGCFSKLRCCSRSDRLRETFNQLCLHIHNHYDKEMEYILDEGEYRTYTYIHTNVIQLKVK